MKAKNQKKYLTMSLLAKVSLSNAKFDVFMYELGVYTLYFNAHGNMYLKPGNPY
jgi:hypothetical protein